MKYSSSYFFFFTAKNVFRISFMDNSLGQSHTVMANDEHDKRQWMLSFQRVTSHIVKIGPHGEKNVDKKWLLAMDYALSLFVKDQSAWLGL